MNHAVKLTDFPIGIRQNWIVNGCLLCFIDIGDPALVTLRGIHTQGQRLHIALLPFRAQSGHLAQFRGAHRCVVSRVGKQHDPMISAKVVKVDRTKL